MYMQVPSLLLLSKFSLSLNFDDFMSKCQVFLSFFKFILLGLEFVELLCCAD